MQTCSQGLKPTMQGKRAHAIGMEMQVPCTRARGALSKLRGAAFQPYVVATKELLA